MNVKKLLAAFLCYGIGCPVFAQVTLKGMVIGENEEPLAGGNVWIEYTTIGASTNAKGEFLLEKIPDGNHTLKVSMVGYAGVSEPVNTSSGNLVIRMKASQLKLNEVVVTGTGTMNRQSSAPVTVDVISRKELQNAALPSFVDAMVALSPSLSFTPNAMGSGLQLNGLSNKYVLIMVDGKRLAGDVSGNIDLSRINMYNIKRIEILKGAASSLYGSEAIGGVINIITQNRNETLFVSSDTRYAGYGQFSQAINVDMNTKWFSASTSYQHNQSDGWKLNPQEKTSAGKLKDTYKQAVNASHSDVLSQKFTVHVSDALNAYIEGSLFERKTKRAVEYGYDLKYTDYAIGVGANYSLKDKGVINFDLHTDNFDYLKVYTADKKTHRIGEEDRQRRQKYYDANLKGTFNLGGMNRIVAGTQYQLNYLDSQSDIADGSREVYTLSFYLQDEIRLFDKKLQLVPGIRYVYNETFKTRLTPKMSALYSFGHFKFRASYSAGYRAPDLKHLFSNTESKASGGKTSLVLANINLKPELSNYYSLNAEYTNRFLTVSVSGYINEVKDLITRRETESFNTAYEGQFDNIKQYVNASKVRIKGIDISANSDLGHNITMGIGYNLVDSKNEDTGKPLEKISKHTGTVNAGWHKKWWKLTSHINLNGRLQSKRYYAAEDGRSFNLWNFSTRHTFEQHNGIILEPGFGVENLFDFIDTRPYGANYATLSPGRTYYVSLSVRFSK